MKFKITKPAFRIFLIYLIIGLLYIFYSDTLVLKFFKEEKQITFIQTIKGWGFIVVTALILVFLINREIRKKNLWNERLAKINKIIQRLAGTVKVEEVFSTTVDACHELLGADGIIFCIREIQGWRVVQSQGPVEIEQGILISADKSLSEKTMQENIPVVYSEKNGYTSLITSIYHNSSVKKIIVFPLRWKENFASAEVLWCSDKATGKEEMELLDTIFNAMNISLSTSTVFADMEQRRDEFYSLYREHKTLSDELTEANANLTESKERYKNLYNSIHDSILVLDESGNIIHCNRSFTELFGYELQNISELLLSEIISEAGSGNEQVEALIRYNDPSSRLITVTCRRNDLSIFPAEIGISVLENSKGFKTGYIIHIRDISERLKTEEALLDSEGKFQSFVNNANDIIYAIDPDGTFSYVSPNWKVKLGHEAEEITGKNCLQFIHPEDQNIFSTVFRQTLEGGITAGGTEYRIKHQNGSWRWHLSTGSIVFDKSGKVKSFIGIARDITDRKLVESTLQERNVFIQTILDNLPIGLALNRFQGGEAMYINAKFEEIYGWKKEFIHNLDDFFYRVFPDDSYRNQIKNQVMDDIKSGDPSRMHWENIKITRSDGSTGIVNAVNIPLFEQDTIISTVMDVTSQHNARESIQLAQNRLLRAEKVAGIGNWELNMTNGRVDASQGAKDVYGLSGEYFTLQLVQEVPLPEFRPVLDNSLKELILRGKPYNERFKIIRKSDNQIRHIHSIAEFDPERKTVFGIIRDITELVQAEERFKDFIQNSPSAVMLVNPDGQFMFANPATYDLLGYSAEELGKLNLKGLAVSDLMEMKLNKLKMLDIKDTVKSTEIQFRHKNGQVIDLSLDMVKTDTNEFLAFCRDITNLKNTQRQLSEKNEEYTRLNEELEGSLSRSKEMNEALKLANRIAEESNRLKTAFLNNMSHEIRTPMNAILGFSDLLTDLSLDHGKREEYVQIVKTSGEQLLHIIDDILDISKLEAGLIKIVHSSFSLNEVIEFSEAIAENLIRMRGKNILVRKIKSLPDGNDTIYTDKTRIMQIMNNLISNAVKYTESGYIEIGYTIHNDFITLCVKDTGIGIPENQHHAIFERFRQSEETVLNAAGGTGLGLSIVKGLAELMEGTVRVESSPGAGAYFYVTVPYHPSEILAGSSNRQVQITGTHVVNILIAEDDLLSLALLREYLSVISTNIIHVEDGLKAVEEVKNNEKVDLVFMDVRMPVLDGLEATRQIKKIRPDLPVIAQTAYAMQGDQEKAFEAGCDSYITKPIDRNILMQTIKRFLMIILLVGGGFNLFAGNWNPELPLIIHKADCTEYLVLHITGDGGWRGFDMKLAEEFRKDGYSYVFLDAFKYFWESKTPEQLSADLTRVIAEYTDLWNKKKIILSGFSFGAEVLPFVYNRLPKNQKQLVTEMVIITPAATSDFTIHLTDMAGVDHVYPYDVVKEVERIRDIKILALFGDEEHSTFPANHRQENYRMETVKGSHHFTDAYGVMRIIKESLK